jgi:hypothetical protein
MVVSGLVGIFGRCVWRANGNSEKVSKFLSYHRNAQLLTLADEEKEG